MPSSSPTPSSLANSDGEGRFWDDEAKAMLTGVILFVATSKTEEGNRHLGRVRDILLLDEDDFKAVLTTMFKEPLPVVSSTAARTASKDVKLRSNVMASVQSHTHFLDSPRIRESLSASDFSFEDLKTRPMTVYLILPADRLKTFDRWLRLLIQQAITVNARNILVKPEKPVLFLLDEMASLGRLSMVEQAYGLMAGFGMQLWGIVQDLSQLERIYGAGWQTFISNSGVDPVFWQPRQDHGGIFLDDVRRDHDPHFLLVLRFGKGFRHIEQHARRQQQQREHEPHAHDQLE